MIYRFQHELTYHVQSPKAKITLTKNKRYISEEPEWSSLSISTLSLSVSQSTITLILVVASFMLGWLMVGHWVNIFLKAFLHIVYYVRY